MTPAAGAPDTARPDTARPDTARPDTARLVAALEAGWPPAQIARHGAFVLREGRGGGQRVCATTAAGAFTAPELEAVIAQMLARGGPPVFQILPGPDSAALDRALGALGWQVRDPVGLFAVRPGPVAALDLPTATTFGVWPPLAIQRELWAAADIGPARLAVMERAAGPKLAILGRSDETPAGTAFISVSDGIAGIHAVAVDPRVRRSGVARRMMIEAARWALRQQADWLALAVTGTNAPARALYASLGMREVEQYHYRIPPEPRP